MTVWPQYASLIANAVARLEARWPVADMATKGVSPPIITIYSDGTEDPSRRHAYFATPEMAVQRWLMTVEEMFANAPPGAKLYWLEKPELSCLRVVSAELNPPSWWVRAKMAVQ